MRSRPLFWFYLFVAYIIFQFIWWTVLFIQLISDASLTDQEYQGKVIMVLGEGSVFFIILILGIIQVRRTFKKDNALNHLQKNFLLAASHELKTPLTSAKIRLQTLQKHQIEEQQKNKIIHSSINDLNRLGKLVDKIMMAAQLEKQSLSINKEKADIKALIEDRIQFWNELYPKRVLLKNDSDVTFETDAVAFVSILDNLVENALKYSDKEVTIGIDLRDRKLHLTVSDQGQGIPKSVQKEIFTMFFRNQNEDTRQVKGAGLGLYIVDNLVKELHGKILIHSSNNKGTTFEVILP